VGDLTAGKGLSALSGQRVVDLARTTLDAGEALVATWTDLEPIVKALIAKVRRHAEQPAVAEEKAVGLLRECANVSARLSQAATSVLRASEGQVRLAVLLEGPRPQRRAPGELTERQLVAVVLETARRVKVEQGTCPLCTTTVAAATTNGAAAPAGEA
jgi:hypothetical protein